MWQQDQPAPADDDAWRLLPGDRTARRDMLVLVLLALVLYAPFIGWGIPEANAPGRIGTFATDEILPLGPLAELRSSLIAPQPDRNYGYPLWHYVVDAAAQAPYLAYLWVTGGLSRPTGLYPFGLEDPVTALRGLTLAGRSVTVLMAAGILLNVYWFGRLGWDRPTGLVAAVLTSISYSMVYYSRTGNVDVPAYFWTSAGAVVFALIVRDGLTARRVTALGVLAGLAMATKDQALVFFLPFGLALFAPSVPRRDDAPTIGRTIVIGLGASIAAYLLATGMLIDPRRQLTHMGGLLLHPEWVTVASAPLVTRLDRTAAGLAGLTLSYVVKLGDAVSWPVLLVAAVGAWWCRSKSMLRIAALASPLVLLFALLAVPTGFVVRRYFLPSTMMIDVFAACVVVHMWRERSKAMARALLILMLGLRLAQVVDLSYAQWKDTRYTAAEWLATRTQAGSRIGYFGGRSIQPHVRADVVLSRIPGQLRASGVESTAESIAGYLTTSAPDFVVVIPDYSAPTREYSRDLPTPVFDGLHDGRFGYALAVHVPPVGLLPSGWRPQLDYPTVAPPVRIFARTGRDSGDTRR